MDKNSKFNGGNEYGQKETHSTTKGTIIIGKTLIAVLMSFFLSILVASIKVNNEKYHFIKLPK
jgi:hypothetical protein